MYDGPEQARVVTSFENLYLSSSNEDINYHHHEEGLASQKAFKKQVINMSDTMNNYGNTWSTEAQ